jgi:hypothetical protein
MKISDIVIILLILIPGIISEKIAYSLDIPSEEKRSEFKELVNGILLSIPISLISFGVFCIYYKFNSIDQLVSAFRGTQFTLKFTIFSLLITVLLGLTLGFCKEKLLSLVNTFRSKHLKKIKIHDKDPWAKYFLDSTEQKYLKVHIGDKTFSGLSKYYSLPGDEKQIVLYKPDVWRHYEGIEDKFKDISGVYVNLEKNIVIEDYDMKEYNDFCDEENNV